MSESIVEGLAKHMGDPKEGLKRKQHMDRDVRYAFAHYEEWRRLFQNQWVAVYGEELVGVNDSQIRLVDELRAKDVPTAETYMMFLSTQRVWHILSSAL